MGGERRSPVRAELGVMISITYLFLVGAIIAAIVGAMGKCPWYVSVLLLCIVVALQVLPVK